MYFKFNSGRAPIFFLYLTIAASILFFLTVAYVFLKYGSDHTGSLLIVFLLPLILYALIFSLFPAYFSKESTVTAMTCDKNRSAVIFDIQDTKRKPFKKIVKLEDIEKVLFYAKYVNESSVTISIHFYTTSQEIIKIPTTDIKKFLEAYCYLKEREYFKIETSEDFSCAFASLLDHYKKKGNFGFKIEHPAGFWLAICAISFAIVLIIFFYIILR